MNFSSWDQAMEKGKAAAPSVSVCPPTFTSEQREAVTLALDGHSICITGSAGTGKSFLLKFLIQQLRIKHGARRVFVCASTGIAATHIDGATLHSVAGVGIDMSDMNRLVKKAANKSSNWHDMSVLIIDEISMVSPHFFTLLNTLAKKVRNGSKPMGGIQLIALGDFMQLPYIDKDYNKKREKDSTLPKDPIPLPMCKTWKDVIERVVLLTQVQRQKNPEFIALLQRVRMGQITDEDDALLRSRVGATLTNNGIEPTIIHTHKANVEEENVRRLAALPGQEWEFTSRDEGPDQFALKKLQDNCLAPTTLKLKEGAQVMLVKNLMPPDLVNGSRGVVIGFRAVVPGEPVYPDVRFENGQVFNMTPQVWKAEKGEVVQAKRSQIPLCLAWALTVHKCQGMSLDKVKMDISRCFASGQAYVALSRCTSLEGMTLINYNRKAIQVDLRAVKFYADLGDPQAQQRMQLEEEEEEEPAPPAAKKPKSNLWMKSYEKK